MTTWRGWRAWLRRRSEMLAVLGYLALMLLSPFLYLGLQQIARWTHG